jgi:acyl-CoA synthetase (AMP-forming)/AMP-acid ligase II
MSLAVLLEMAAETWPDRLMVGSAATGMTTQAVLDAARNAAAQMRGTGADSVAFLDVNGPGFVVALWAAALAGLPLCPLSYRMSRDMLLPLVGSLEHPLIVVGSMYRPLLAGTEATLIRTEDLLTVKAAGDVGILADVDHDITAVQLFTSGTTAAPKGVTLTHDNLVSYVLDTIEFGSAGPTEATLVSMPPYHVAGVNGVLTNFYAGRRIVHLPNFSAESWLATVRAEAVTHAMVVPTMLARIIDALADGPADTPSLRHLAYGGAPMPRIVLEKALELFAEVEFVNAYGLSETSSTVAVLGPQDHRLALASQEPKVRERLSSVGRVFPGIEAQIREESGQLATSGEVGELWLRGRQVSGEYVGQGSSLDAHGWFPTRDKAHFDHDGYLFIDGRADDTIIRAGENIAPAEIEEVLLDHPDIADAAVIGLPDDEWGERIVAAVVLQQGAILEAGDVTGYVQVRLRASRTPDDVIFVAELPYSATGKLVRGDLVAQLGEQLSRDLSDDS